MLKQRPVSPGISIARAAWWLPTLSGCFLVYGTKPAELRAPAEPYTVSTRVKAHLADGSTVIYPNGVQLREDSVFGAGTRFSLVLNQSTPVGTLPLDSVVAMETFHDTVRPAETVLVSALATVGVTAISVAIICAADPKCFGSCPTVYSDSAGTAVLEAEGFSYSIAPLFERRDVDRLRAQPDASGRLSLEVRNEALETHFINHLELLAVQHRPDEWATTDAEGRPVATRNLAPPARAVDRAGRDVLPEVAAHDGRVFRTAAPTLAAADRDDMGDWIDVEFPNPAGADSLALAFRMRNSLLATVLLYDLMLGDRGPRALDWMARDLTQIAPALDLARWAAEYLGMRLLVWDGAAYRPAGRVHDAGPVAWKDVVAVVPTLGRPVVRVRLEFVADNWRIDRIAAAGQWRRLEATTVPLARVVDARGQPDTAALHALAVPDERYVESPGGRSLVAQFVVPALPGGAAGTYFLASQGYYIEWLRREWLAARNATPFIPGPAALFDALRRWRASQDDTERRFYATRVPVR